MSGNHESNTGKGTCQELSDVWPHPELPLHHSTSLPIDRKHGGGSTN
jgi:hypothetical protein